MSLLPVPTSNFRQLPPVWEMAQPFHIDVTGAVGYDTDPVAWAKNHILAILLTTSGERVMRPTYGVGMYRMVFENDNALIEQQIITAIQMSVSMWEPNITIDFCNFMPQPNFSGIMELEVGFSVGSLPTIYTVSYAISGRGVEVQA